MYVRIINVQTGNHSARLSKQICLFFHLLHHKNLLQVDVVVMVLVHVLFKIQENPKTSARIRFNSVPRLEVAEARLQSPVGLFVILAQQRWFTDVRLFSAYF